MKSFSTIVAALRQHISSSFSPLHFIHSFSLVFFRSRARLSFQFIRAEWVWGVRRWVNSIWLPHARERERKGSPMLQSDEIDKSNSWIESDEMAKIALNRTLSRDRENVLFGVFQWFRNDDDVMMMMLSRAQADERVAMSWQAIEVIINNKESNNQLIVVSRGSFNRLLRSNCLPLQHCAVKGESVGVESQSFFTSTTRTRTFLCRTFVHVTKTNDTLFSPFFGSSSRRFTSIRLFLFYDSS